MRPLFLSVITLIGSLVLPCGSCLAAVREGIHFPERLSVAGRNLLLNGVGLYQKSIFKVDIYVAGLYLQKPAREEEQILESEQVKKVVMVFLHDASSKQLADGWKDSFQESCGDSCDSLQPEISRFIAFLTNVHRGQEIRFTFYPNRLAIESEGRKTAIPGAKFTETFLATFIGSHAGAEDVRRGLLSNGEA